MRKADRILGFILVALSVYIIVTASSLVLWVTGANTAPGPGFLPMVTGSLMLLLSASLATRSFIGKKYDDSETSVFDKESLRYMCIIIGSAVAASLIVKITGFVIAIGFMSGVLMITLAEEKNYKLAGMVTVIIPVALYVIFKIGLEVQLPVGIFGI